MAQQTGQSYVMREGSQVTRGFEAQTYNIMAAMAVAGAVISTLGPRGMDKMLVDSTGDISVSNDGATILRKMDIEHPAAKMIVEVAKTQDAEVGDGTTTAVVLAGELLRQAGVLTEKSVHQSSIIKGYLMAAEKALEIVKDMGVEVTEKDTAMLKKIAGTAMTGKDTENAKDFLSDLVVKSVAVTMQKDAAGKYYVERENLVFEKKKGGDVTDSKIIEGVLIDKGKVNFQMPSRLENVKVLAMDIGIEAKDTQFDAEFKIKVPGQFKQFADMEDRQIKEQVDKIAKLGVKAVFTTKAIDDLAQHYMAKYGIIGLRRLKTSDVRRVAKATGGSLVTNLDGITPADIGTAGLIEEITVGDDEMVLVSKCKDKKVTSVILRGVSEHILDEYERGIDDALHAVQNSIKDGKIVPGGAAVEAEISLRLKQYAMTVKGKEQLAIDAFASAMEVIPKALATNAGLSPIDMMIALKSKHGAKDGKNFGLNVYKGKPMDMLKEGVVEPMKLKTQAIQSATEAAIMILRIDDILAAAQTKNPAPGRR
ncbi:thermosome subunit alpha [Methanocella arvoryzae]|uniref:Chaperonin Hsp60 (GroEL-like) n=1 Tax=Methanocella arvoryzae (strain DSM 22066 / NBRC 105507 / MRE50) TaxID=351160 RepID=Q0W8R0_METAR|nr:thermosome subunit alpha [Methanocella arvoryzae]CAJ35233.1 chaperonin Hsp60 (GroEL-like) [Methanocella arvoryzae MRE50]